MTKPLIKSFDDAGHQRNGVAGEPFFVIKFTPREETTSGRATAIVFEKSGHVAVITDDLTEHWRGDRFEPELRAFIESPQCNHMCWPSIYDENGERHPIRA